MKEGSGDVEYKKAYWEIYLKAVKNFSPELIVVSAGYDLHADDPLTGLEVSDEGVREVVRAVLEGSKSVNCPVLFTLEGGYNLAALKRCSYITFEEILKA
jgi:acetoin utilization deacetylase AcuC-like enzyme